MESCRAGLCRRHLRHNPAGRISPAAAVARSPWPTVCRRLCGPGRQDGPRRGPAALAVSSRHHPVSFPHAGHLAGAVRGAASVPHRAYAEGVVRDDRRRLRGPAGRSRRRWGGAAPVESWRRSTGLSTAPPFACRVMHRVIHIIHRAPHPQAVDSVRRQAGARLPVGTPRGVPARP